jgi:hypothetical protein
MEEMPDDGHKAGEDNFESFLRTRTQSIKIPPKTKGKEDTKKKASKFAGILPAFVMMVPCLLLTYFYLMCSKHDESELG